MKLSQFFTCLLLFPLFNIAYAQNCANQDLEETTPTDRYIFNENGYVLDAYTQLMWKRCLEGQIFNDGGTLSDYSDDRCLGEPQQFYWKAALEDTQVLNLQGGFSGYTDWRIPNIKELRSIVEYCRIKPAINTDVFVGYNNKPKSSISVWSSTPVVTAGNGSYDSSWSINFSHDALGTWSQHLYEKNYVRLVRGQ